MTENKKTLVIGGSANPDRFSNKAIRKLRKYGFPVVSIGLREAIVEDVKIEKEKPDYTDIHTVTLYIGKARQPEYYKYLINLKPRRVIFNPGTENDEFSKLLNANGIETIEFCTLIMLDRNTF